MVNVDNVKKIIFIQTLCINMQLFIDCKLNK